MNDRLLLREMESHIKQMTTLLLKECDNAVEFGAMSILAINRLSAAILDAGSEQGRTARSKGPAK